MTKRYAKGERRGGKIIDEYLYDDEHGKLYAKVTRTEDPDNPKRHQFPQYTWGVVDRENGKEGWLPKQPKPKKPYNLPQLLAAKSDVPVYITEGEKDSDTLSDWSLIATTNPGGSGKWVGKDLNKWLKGRHIVYVLEDNDDPGRDHALHVATEMCGIGVPNVHIVRFDDLKEGQDVTDWVEQHGGDKEAFLKRCEEAPRFEPKPVVRIVKGEIHDTANAIESALRQVKAPILKRDINVLVQPLWNLETDTFHGQQTKTGKLQRLNWRGLADIVSKRIELQQYNEKKGGWSKVDPSEKHMLHILERGHPSFPTVAGIIGAPTMRHDGTILNTEGYDDKTHLWLVKDESILMPAIQKKPTKVDAQAALAKLDALLAEFPFRDGTLDRAVALASILTTVLRGALDVTPMFLINAHDMGTGKSYFVTLISHIITGRPCPVIAASSDPNEFEKQLGSLLLEGPPIISLDNCEGELGGTQLCLMTEQQAVKIRVLGLSSTPTCEWRGMLFATGNNVKLTGDITRRTLTCNMNAGMETAWTRRFKQDPIKMVMKDRGEYIGAAMTIALAYKHASAKEKAKVQCEPIASYGRWSEFVRKPLLWLGQADPVQSMKQARQNDPARQEVQDLFDLWQSGTIKNLKVDAPITVNDMIKITAFAPDLHRVLFNVANVGKEISAKRLGKWLAKIEGKVQNNFFVEVDRSDHKSGNHWVLRRSQGAPK